MASKRANVGEARQDTDVIDRPYHYTRGGIEPIDFINSHNMGFMQGNVIKYVTRYRYKGTPLEDLKKARAYIDRLIEQEKQRALQAEFERVQKQHRN